METKRLPRSDMSQVVCWRRQPNFRAESVQKTVDRYTVAQAGYALGPGSRTSLEIDLSRPLCAGSGRLIVKRRWLRRRCLAPCQVVSPMAPLLAIFREPGAGVLQETDQIEAHEKLRGASTWARTQA